MQLPEARMSLVHDAADTPTATRALHALHDLDGGVVVVRVTPGPRRLNAMAMDVLTALGKDDSRTGRVRDGEENWRRCAAWMSGERVRHLIVDRAETLGVHQWRAFVALAALCGPSLWLIAHGGSLTRVQRESRSELPLTEIMFEEFLAQHASESPGCADTQGTGLETSPADPTPFPALPRSDFTTFRADCRLLLSPDDFQRVEDEIQRAAESTRRWLSGMSDPTEDGLKDHLRGLIDGCRSSGQALARLRAAQAVCLMRGLLVTVDLERLAASTKMTRPVLDRHVVDQLRAYTSTHRAAAAAVACVTGASPEAITRINLGDVTEDEVHVADTRFVVPPLARGLLAAHVHVRLAAGAHDVDALFSNSRRGLLGTRGTPHQIRAVINDVARASGLMLWTEWNTKDDLSHQRWLRRRGVSVQRV